MNYLMAYFLVENKLLDMVGAGGRGSVRSKRMLNSHTTRMNLFIVHFRWFCGEKMLTRSLKAMCNKIIIKW